MRRREKNLMILLTLLSFGTLLVLPSSSSFVLQHSTTRTSPSAWKVFCSTSRCSRCEPKATSDGVRTASLGRQQQWLHNDRSFVFDTRVGGRGIVGGGGGRSSYHFVGPLGMVSTNEQRPPPETKKKVESSQQYDVIYQKIIRPTTNNIQTPQLFLTSLVTYIQDYFVLPDNLPMVYETSVPSSMSDTGEKEHSILILDSPLAKSNVGDMEVRLEVEVLGIYPGDDEEEEEGDNEAKASFPTMAMVAVKKKKKKRSNHPPAAGSRGSSSVMVRNLFEESERLILKALDNGLNDFMEGKIQVKLDDGSSRQNYESTTTLSGVDDGGAAAVGRKKKKNASTAEEAIRLEMETELEEQERQEQRKRATPLEITNDGMGNVVIDTYATSATSSSSSSSDYSSGGGIGGAAGGGGGGVGRTSIGEGDDYAVKAARRKKRASAEGAAKKKRLSSSFSGVGAVAAGTDAAAPVSDKKKDRSSSSNTRIDITTKTEEEEEEEEYAVMAAKRKAAAAAAVAAASGTAGNDGDYAVNAAKEAAAALKKMKKKTKKKKKKTKKVKITAAQEAKTNNNKLQQKTADVNSGAAAVAAVSKTRQKRKFDIETAKKEDSSMFAKTTLPKKWEVTVSTPEERKKLKKKNKSVAKKTAKKTTPAKTKQAKKLSVKESPTANEEEKKMIMKSKTTTRLEEEERDNDTIDALVDAPPSSSSSMAQQQEAKTSSVFTTKREVNILEQPSSLSVKPSQIMTEEARNKVYDNVMLDSISKRGKRNEPSNTDPQTSSPLNSYPDNDVMKTKNKTEEEIQSDIRTQATRILNDMANTYGQDMSPEELLSNILKFGDEQEKEQVEDGSGFVNAALEKARSLLLEEQRKVDARKKKKVEVMEMEGAILNDDPAPGKKKKKSTEQELKDLFRAGEQLADGYITQKVPPTTNAAANDNTMTERSSITQEDIDYLIQEDDTISNNVRTIDEQLVQLEIRIAKSVDEQQQDENLEEEGKYPKFDIMNGPSTYNPNVVDIENEVNWPGAQRGTRVVKGGMARELEEAVKQAQFAASTLIRLKEVIPNEKEEGGTTRYFLGKNELTQTQVQTMQDIVSEAVSVGLIEDPILYMSERSRLQLVLDELKQPGAAEDRFEEIVSNYKDLLLSDNFITLVRERLENMKQRDINAQQKQGGEGDSDMEEAHKVERTNLIRLTQYAQLLLKQCRALGAELEASYLEVIRMICQVAMDPKHVTEEETSIALTDAVRDMKPLLDDSFVAYLKYAIDEEEGKLSRAGVLDDMNYNRWWFVLKIVQEGVYAELSRSINRYIEHIWYVLRMETRSERKALLSKLVDVMPTMDVRPFVAVIDNIVGSLGMSVKGDFDEKGSVVLGEMTNKLLQLHRDVRDILPPERIDLMAKDADEWAEEQRRRLMEQRGITKQRLQAAKETGGYDEESNKGLGRRGEVERFT